jgi:hypothetical protein
VGQTPCLSHGGPCFYDEPGSSLRLAFVDGELSMLGPAAIQRLASRSLDRIDNATALTGEEEEALREFLRDVLPQLLSPRRTDDPRLLAARTAALVSTMGVQAGVVVLATCDCATGRHTAKVTL